jgi:hypothetical protein
MIDVSILTKVQEQLNALSALKVAATEIYEQKRKRKEPPTESQPSKVKKAKT